jgi:hypothetical protein
MPATEQNVPNVIYNVTLMLEFVKTFVMHVMHNEYAKNIVDLYSNTVYIVVVLYK